MIELLDDMDPMVRIRAVQSLGNNPHPAGIQPIKDLLVHELDADVIVVNTCSFIDPAKKESIDTILEMAEFKRTGKAQRLIVADEVHAVVPVAAAHQRQAVRAAAQAAVDGAGGVLGVLPGLIGTIQATEALKLILGKVRRHRARSSAGFCPNLSGFCSVP